MKLLNTAAIGLLLATSSLLNIANANLIELAEKSSNTSGGVISYSEVVDNTYSVASDAIFTLELWGDLNWYNENVNVDLESLDLGIVLNNNPNDDSFDFSYDQTHGFFFTWVTTEVDTGLYRQTLVGQATIARADWANVVSDGVVNISLDASNRVTSWFGGKSFSSSGSISYDVPEPSSLAIFGLALFGLGARRLKK